MSILPILHYPDERLHTKAKPVAVVDDAIRQLVADMAETMYAAPGIGLAATQVDVHLRVIVMDISETHDQLLTLINPVILKAEGKAEREEGCLSVPGIYEPVTRAAHITVKYLNLEGKEITQEAEGLIGVCIQHEMDHLEGRVFVEYLSRLKQGRIKFKMKKRARETM
ncbi:MAG: peptide deformylase [Betaproteobacteria bacterium RBG_16_58_11]|nr:MAG: peptide deformylase [Betaproteobacteria bacterium RBG_16_58_11]OFZ99164.1 MAG: peptide deformylase [Betaproteobacteria bacterium RBG_19FT_COMBO_58_11]